MNLYKIIAYAIFVLAIMISVVAVGMILPGCRTFKPIWVEKLPAECNMSLNAMSLYYVSADKSGVMPSLAACERCLNRMRCQVEVFGVSEKGEPNPVIYTGTKYRDYEQCRSELK